MDYTKRLLAGTAVLALALALTACGQGEPQGPATLEVASVPPAEVWIDGASHGTTPQKVSLDAGSHSVVLKRDLFVDHEAKIDLKSGETTKVEASMKGADPGDPEVIRVLNEIAEIEQEPFELGSTTRGGGSDEIATLLWPKKDVRLNGLTVFAIEVALEYEMNGFLEFKKGREVLYREKFEPEKVTTVAPIPAVVKEALKSGDSVTWGLVFEKKRDNVTSKFKVVKGTSAGKALEKLERRKFYKRQPPLTQALMRAQVLHNKRLYTEALIANLTAAQAFPTSIQPYQGIVTSLRRMDGKDSELWTVAARYVQGAGPKSRLRQGGGAAGKGSRPGGQPPLNNWHVGRQGAIAGEPPVLGAGDGVAPGLRPLPETGEPPSGKDPAGTAGDPASPDTPDNTQAAVDDLRERERQIERQMRGPQRQADQAREEANRLAGAAQAAHQAADAANQAREAADQAVEQARNENETNPSQANQDALEAAEAQAREAAEAAQRAAEEAGEAQRQADQADRKADRQERELRRQQRALDDVQREIARLTGQPEEGPDGPGEVVDPRRGNRREKMQQQRLQRHAQALTHYTDTQRDLGAAQATLADLEARALEMLKAKDVTKDPVMDPAYGELVEEIAAAREEVARLQAEADDKQSQYVESLRVLTGPNPDFQAVVARMERERADVQEAQDAVRQAEEVLQQDTDDPASLQTLVEARERLKEAQATLARTLEAYEEAIKDE